MSQEKSVWSKELAAQRSQHEVVATLREGQIVCTITSRMFNGAPSYSYSFVKEYEKDGEARRSHWFDKRYTSDLLALLEKADAWIKAAEAKNGKRSAR
jgi:hypothetical protein